ncbi:hypothetical protein HGRIS_009819 [Hohenbuehelia grisea]|uniref:Threonylcarbamoyl-AMP synthase n=1 Tax=Hohenbuehelia grisea TaxID=104357 RepID=A0ABR3J3R8_9AGAR
MTPILNLLRNLHTKLFRTHGATIPAEAVYHPMTRVLSCISSSISFSPGTPCPVVNDEDTERALREAARLLVGDQQVVVFPTETVYGLGAVATNESAVSRIFSTKGRPPDNPLIVHVSSLDMLYALLSPGYTLSRTYKALIDNFWPGALTLLFPRDPERIPSIVSAGQPTVAIRMPSHPIARALIAISNAPLAAPSANSSGKPSPTKAEHVERDLDGKIELILDGGACGVGLESTVVDGLHPDGNIRVLRPGGVTVEAIERVLQEQACYGGVPRVLVHRRDFSDVSLEQAPTTPGMKYRHYSPSVPVTLLLTQSKPPLGDASLSPSAYLDALLREDERSSPPKLGLLVADDSSLMELTSYTGVVWHHYSLGSIRNPAEVAHRLFDGLLTLEREGVERILIEEISEDQEGLAVMNRVRKAASETRWIAIDGAT